MSVTYVDRIYYRETQYKKVYRGDSLDWAVMNTDYFYVENLYNGLNTVTLKKIGSPTSGTTIEWSGDKVTWTPVVYDAHNEFLIGIPNLNQKVYFRSTDGFSSTNSDRYRFFATENHSVGGDARTLIDYTDSTLDTAPAWCFRSLFESDSTLVDISNFDLSHLINVSLGCYRGTFAITGITDASMLYLPAMTLAEDCYRSLFYHCYSLVHAPEFPATTLATNCYRGMFAVCSSLIEAPEFPATTLATEAYVDLFNGCSLIDKITTYIQNWNTTDTLNWVKNVAATGDFYNLGGATIPTGNNGIPSGWVELKSKALSFTNKSSSNNTLTLTRYNSNGQCPVVNLEYSTDGQNWQEWQAVNDVRTYTIPANGTVYLRGNNTAFGQNANGTDYHNFSSTGDIEAHGNIMSLLDKTMQSTTITSTGCFRSLFRNMTNLKTAPELPATNLNNAAYIYMFLNTGITEAPDLPATRIGNGYYYGMFYQCASLTKAAKMTINEFISGHVNACREMYYGCSALTDISGITINATNISPYAFKLTFQNCTSLTKAVPMTIAQVGAFAFDSCYEGCSALTDISGVHITTTSAGEGSFKIMFRGTAITESPDLSSITTLYSATNNGSFSFMFQNCANLNKVTVGCSTWNTDYANSWLSGVAATGDFYNLGGATLPTGTNGIPSGWTTHTSL